MRIMKLIGLAAITVLALAATAASASALPEFLTAKNRCDLSATAPPGAWPFPYTTEANCLADTGPVSGDWWWLILHFRSTLGAGKLVAGSNVISCTSGHNLGEIYAARRILVLVTFLGCKLEPFSFECKSKGAKAEEIMTKKLLGTLGYINKATKLVGVKLEPEGGGEYTEGEIECLGQKVKVTGDVIGHATPTNTKSTTGTLTFTASGTKQAFEEIEIEGKKETGLKLKASLNGGAAEEASEETTDTITFSESVELMA